jgi:hypothetical protein
MIAFYIYIYWFEPFSEFWNQFFSNFFLQVASLAAAIVATWIWSLYEKTDAPRKVWGPFAVGAWFWFAAELTWGYLNMTVGDVYVGVPDIFWVASYFVFGIALVNQYQIVFQPDKRTLWKNVFIIALALFAFTLLIYSVFILAVDNPSRLDTAVNSFYPAGDLLLAVVALWLARHFRGGAFARPWLGLLVFTFSDLLYAWLEASGTYAWSVTEGNLFSTVADVAYLTAYLVLFVGVLYQWLFLKYGMLSPGDGQ